ncbi:MAG: ATP-binding cassette domain-containing protein [Verrucomicrobiota bacterium]
MPLLELDAVTKTFTKRSGLLGRSVEQVEAVKEVSLAVERGEILGLVGESGCGKSTLSRCVMQLLPVTSGRIVLEGQELTALSQWQVRPLRLNFQMVFQDPYASLNPRMTIFSTLAEAVRQRHPRAQESDLEKRIGKLMETVGLSAKALRKYPHEFSGGQRQRIAIARALAPEPRLIIADEPVSALDVSIQSQILNLLKRLNREFDLTMIFISHDLSVVHYLADRIAVMQLGQIVEEGDAEAVFQSPQHDYTRTLLSAIPLLSPN